MSLNSNLTGIHMSITAWMPLNSKTHLYSLPPPKKGPGVAKNDDSEIIEISRVLLNIHLDVIRLEIQYFWINVPFPCHQGCGTGTLSP